MELPEITILAQQMHEKLKGKKFKEVSLSNDKVLNVSLDEFTSKLVGSTVERVEPRGKWVIISLDNGYSVLYNTGMGADTLYYTNESKLPEEYHHSFKFTDNTGFTIRVWWFVHIHLMETDKIHTHKQVGTMGKTPLDPEFTPEYFKELVTGRRGGVKSLLTNQKHVGGIGNVYIQDPLFLAGIHPLRKWNSLSEEEVMKIYESTRQVLTESLDAGGLAYEKQFNGKKGTYNKDNFRVGYKENEPCPVCGTTIIKIKTGSTSSYICLKCQPLE
jgi:formamidopyrimidine-DNA glycosylase